ncbi:hypothetical protein [Desulfobulbus propionicus]
MNSLLHRVYGQSPQPLETVVVIGAGNASGLTALRKLRGKRLILVEAHPQQVENLTRWIRPDLNEELHPLAIITGKAHSVSLYPCNNTNFSSVARPESLLETAPNLRFSKSIEVPAQSFDTFMTALRLDAPANNLLVLDAPGISARIPTTASPALLHFFSWIIVCDGAVNGLYHNDASTAEAVSHLETIGFENICEDDEALYPRTAHLLARHPERVARYTLVRELETVQGALVEAQTVANERQTLVETLSQQLDTLAEEKSCLAQAKNALQQTTDEQQGIIKKLSQQREELAKRIDDLQTDKENLARLTEEQKNRIQALNKQKDALAEEKVALAQAKSTLQQTLDEQQGIIKKLSQQREELAKRIDDLHTDKENLARLTEEQKSRIQALNKQKDALAEEKVVLAQTKDKLQQTLNEQKSTVENLTKARNAAQAQLREQEVRLTQTEAQVKEQEHRQQLLQEELIKAEAQIDLIKDLLLREPGL